MKFQAITLLLAAATSVVAQAVTDSIAPTAVAPPGCKPTFDGRFEISIQDIVPQEVSPALKVRLPPLPAGLPLPIPDCGLVADQCRSPTQARAANRACPGEGVLVVEVADTVMKDAQGRVAYLADNFQFQFDGPPQAGALFTAGFSVCGNGSIALGDSTVFYKCQSGDIYNLYDRWIAEQCSPVRLNVMPCGGDVQDPQNVVGSAVVSTTVVMPLSDGQPQVVTTTTVIPMCQIGDGKFLRSLFRSSPLLTSLSPRSSPRPHHPLRPGPAHECDSHPAGTRWPARGHTLPVRDAACCCPNGSRPRSRPQRNYASQHASPAQCRPDQRAQQRRSAPAGIRRGARHRHSRRRHCPLSGAHGFFSRCWETSFTR